MECIGAVAPVGVLLPGMILISDGFAAGVVMVFKEMFGVTGFTYFPAKVPNPDTGLFVGIVSSSRPVAITVIVQVSVCVSSYIAPKMMFTSSPASS